MAAIHERPVPAPAYRVVLHPALRRAMQRIELAIRLYILMVVLAMKVASLFHRTPKPPAC